MHLFVEIYFMELVVEGLQADFEDFWTYVLPSASSFSWSHRQEESSFESENQACKLCSK